MNKTIGMVFSGGGARGFAHLGMLEILFENDIRPNAISGTSIGAIVGALLADGKEPKEIFEIFKNKAMFNFVRPAFSWKALLNLDGMNNLLKKHLSVKNIEDLKIPCVFVASNLLTGKLKTFDSGNLLQALMASSAIPMVFDPIKIGDALYGDGGLICNLPTKFVNADVIIGLNLVPVPEVTQLNTPLRMGERTASIAIDQNAKADKEACHILMEPSNLYKYRFLDIGKAQEMFDLGKEEAKKHLEIIKETISI